MEPEAKKRRLKKGAVPSVFHWTRDESKQEERKELILRPSYSVRSGELNRSVVIGKLDKSRLDIEEATDSASEGEGDKVVGKPELVSRKTKTSWGDIHATRQDGNGKEHFGFPCMHGFSVHHLLSKCTTTKKERTFFSHFCGFNSYQEFHNNLKFVLPDLNINYLIYWGTKKANSHKIDTAKLFQKSNPENSDEEGSDEESSRSQVEGGNTRPAAHFLSSEDQYFMCLMRLRTGATNLDLAERFNVSEGTVSSIILTWIN